MKKLLLGDEAIAQGAIDAILEHLRRRLQSIFRTHPSLRREISIAAGQLMRRPLWRLPSVCRIWASVRWCV